MKYHLNTIGEKLRDIVEIFNNIIDFESHAVFLINEITSKPDLYWHYLTSFDKPSERRIRINSRKNSTFQTVMREGKAKYIVKEKVSYLWIPLSVNRHKIGTLILQGHESKKFSKYTCWLCENVSRLGMKAIEDEKIAGLLEKLRFGILHRKSFFSGVPTTNEVLHEYLIRCIDLFPSKRIWGTARIIELNNSDMISDNIGGCLTQGQNNASLIFRGMLNVNDKIWDSTYNISSDINLINLHSWIESVRKKISSQMIDPDPNYHQYFSNRIHNSHIVLPSIYERTPVALFSFTSPYKNAFNIPNINSIAIIVAQAAPVVLNARSREKTEIQRDWFYRLYEASSKLTRLMDIDEVCSNTVNEVLRISDAKAANILLLKDPEIPESCIMQDPLHVKSAGLGNNFDTKIKPRATGLTAKVLKELKPCAVEYPNDPPGLNTMAQKSGIQSSLCLPIKSKDIVKGMLFTHYEKPHFFTETEIEMLSLFTNHSGIALDNAFLAKKFKVMNEITAELAGSFELDSILDLIAKRVAELLESDNSIFLLIDNKGNLEKVVGYNYAEEFIQSLNMEEIKSGISGWVIKNKKPTLVTNAQTDKRNKGIALENAKRHKTGPLIVVPLLLQDEVKGTLTVCNKVGRAVFTQDDLDLTRMLATHAVFAIEHYNLLLQSKIDVADTFHDLKGNAAMLRGEISNLRLAISKNRKYENILDNLLLISNLMNETTTKLVDISGPKYLKSEIIDLRLLITHLCKSIDRKGIKLKFSYKENIPSITINKESISFIIKETLHNSIDVLKKAKNGLISINLDLAAKRKIPKLLSNSKHKFILITIEDNGPGIALRHKDKIWELGFSRKTGGTGLGLFGVAFHVKRLGGICFENGIPKQGAKFNIFLPLKKENIYV